MHTATALPNVHSAPVKPAFTGFTAFPDEALIDVKVVAGLLGCTRNTVWRRARAGILPAPVKTGPRSTGWRVGAIRQYLANLQGSAA